MTLPDTIHAIGRQPRGDKPAKPGGQWFPVPAEGTRAYRADDLIDPARTALVNLMAAARHAPSCGIVGGYGHCTCGLDDALAEARAALEKLGGG